MARGADGWLYALACVIVPVLWGLVIVWGVDRLQTFAPRRVDDDDDGPVGPEYHI